MSDPAHPPAGGHSDDGSKVGKAWGFAILFIVLAMSGALEMFGQQFQVFIQSMANGFGSLFQVIKMNMSAILIALATFWVIKALRK